MRTLQLMAYREALSCKLRELERIQPTCAQCQHMTAGRCDLFDAVPPAEFQTTPEACEAWEYDGVPF